MRYFLASDDDGHHYLVPADKRQEWEAWVDNPEATGWEPPSWAKSLGCSYTWVTFTDPQREVKAKP